MGTIYETIDLQKTTCSANIISFSPNNVCDDCIDLSYTVGNKTYSSPSENGTYFEINFVRKADEELDRMINSTNDGYFIGDTVENMGIMHQIKGVVYRNTCYYRSDKIVFTKLFYGTTYYVEENKIVIEHYPSLWRYIIIWILTIFIFAALIWGEPDGGM